MSGLSEDHVEGLRREIGEKMGRDKEGVPSADASDSMKAGFRRGNLGFGSNAMPRHFGRSGESPTDWTCTCGHVNSGKVRRKVAGRVVCWMCEITRELAEKASG